MHTFWKSQKMLDSCTNTSPTQFLYDPSFVLPTCLKCASGGYLPLLLSLSPRPPSISEKNSVFFEKFENLLENQLFSFFLISFKNCCIHRYCPLKWSYLVKLRSVEGNFWTDICISDLLKTRKKIWWNFWFFGHFQNLSKKSFCLLRWRRKDRWWWWLVCYIYPMVHYFWEK